MDEIGRYIKSFWRALRAFSLTCALVPTLLGSALAAKDGPVVWWQVLLVIFAGCSIQGGVNLVNDFFEYKQGILPEKNIDLAVFGRKRSLLELFIFLAGLGLFGLAVPIGLYFAWLRGLPILVIGIVGFIGGYFYTGWPVAYKNRGLAVILVFFLMGPLMVAGSYFSLRGTFSVASWVTALPIGLLTQALLVSNEIRDYEDDREKGIRTLAVLKGQDWAKKLHRFLVVGSWVSTAGLVVLGYLPWFSLLALASFFPYLASLKYRDRPRGQRAPFVVLTSRIHLVAGLLMTLGMWLSGHI